MIDLSGKVAIVTGAASYHGSDGGIDVGQGAATAALLARLGAAVVLADINGAAAEQRAGEIRAGGGRAIAIATDVRVEEHVACMVAMALEHFGRLDVLHNNAADLAFLVDPGDPEITQFTVEAWRSQFETLVLGPMLGCKHAIPAMLESGGGSIVCMSSTSGGMGELNLTVYGAAKASVNQLVRAVSAQWGKQGIRCNAVAPSLVLSTPGIRLGPDLIAQYARHCDTPYVADPLDTAHMVAFLASDAARFITGQVINVDGGYAQHSPMATETRESGVMVGASA